MNETNDHMNETREKISIYQANRLRDVHKWRNFFRGEGELEGLEKATYSDDIFLYDFWAKLKKIDS